MIITIAWVAVTMTIIFQAIKHTVGLRVTAEEEIEGLDSKEHGLTSAYDGFVVHDTMTVPTPMGVAKNLFLQILPQMLHLLKLLTPFLTFQEKAYIN